MINLQAFREWHLYWVLQPGHFATTLATRTLTASADVPSTSTSSKPHRRRNAFVAEGLSEKILFGIIGIKSFQPILVR